jgi:hypothetical protein
MGLDRTIRFPTGNPPTWDAIRSRLVQLGESPVLRMIDGLPAFPDETPEPTWNELRLGFSAGMVTLRRTPAGMSCVVWGNADDTLRASWDKLSWACAADGGVIEAGAQALSPAEFAAAVGIPTS